DMQHKWGSMSADQMLWHVSQFLAFSLGEQTTEPHKPSMPLQILRFLVLNAPWPKSAPTHPSALAKDHHDFEAQRARCAGLIERFVARPVAGPWPVDPVFGAVNGKFASRMQAKHLDYHFRQFGG